MKRGALQDTSKVANGSSPAEILFAFARDNGWEYARSVDVSAQSGSLFLFGHDYRFSNVITAPDFEVGEVVAAFGSGETERRYAFGYLALKLDRNVPNMLLDGKKNNHSFFGLSFSNLPIRYDASQIISLEGNFDKYYTLYAPREYEMDARYIFTPDLMQLLMDESEELDIEIIDNNMYVYFSRYDFLRLDFWERVSKIVNVVGGKVDRQTTRYSDDRAGHSGVATHGMRLAGGRSMERYILATIAVLMVAIIIFAPYFLKGE